ncbi:MAG: hypothetical protein IJH39_12575 [Clostridia bacterium]|nr:hypothetical protein [Clostridia bacterium]
MLIEEMLNKRDLSTNVCVALQNQIGKNVAGVFEMDEFEKRDTDEFNEYVSSEMKRLNLKVMIFTGWAFTKSLFEKQYEYVITYENSLYIPELNTIIVADSKGTLINDVIKKIKPEICAASDMNIVNIVESDNGIQINYFTKSAVKYFEERPKSVEEIIQNS